MVKKTKNEEVSMQDLAEWSGENTVRRFRYVVPVLKFNGIKGKFSLLMPDESGNWISKDISKSEIEINILKVRRVLSSYEKLPDGSGLRNFTNEHNTWKDALTVFEMKKGDSKPRMVDMGSSEEVRKRNPNLRLRQNLYCIYDNQIVKLTARGKSLSSLFDYYQKFKANEHIFEFITNLSSHDETNEGGLTYYVLDWERGDKADLPMVAEKIKEVKESLALQDKQYAEFRTAPEYEAKESRPEEETEEGKKEEEIKVENIPM